MCEQQWLSSFRSPNLVVYMAFLMPSCLDIRYKLNILLDAAKKASVWCPLELELAEHLKSHPSVPTQTHVAPPHHLRQYFLIKWAY